MSQHSGQRPAPQTSESDQWLTIDRACKLLGVDQSTLRRWSDAGKIPVFRTPGGHRRYAEKDIRSFMQGETKTRRRFSRTLLTSMSVSAYEADYMRQVRTSSWYRAYSPEQIGELRAAGRRLVDLSIQAVNQAHDRSISSIFEAGRAIGRRYGAISSDAGLSSSDALEAFLFFRYPVFQAIRKFLEEEAMPTERAIGIFSDLSQFLDKVMIAMIKAHAELQNS